MMRWIAAMAALAGALLLAWHGTNTPRPVGASAPATAFSADRSLADVSLVAKVPHPIGSAQNQRVRAALTARMAALGLSPLRQDASVPDARDWDGEDWVIGGSVQNLIGVLPGKDRGKPALALMAHYDSVAASPGAADDATGVAAVLETVRALKARGTPERDVMVILTDGEEAGLLGARAFFADHPLRSRIGLLINLEARGSGGRANMFQTGPQNGALVATFAKSASRPISNSLAVFLYETMPNDTDFSVSKEAGIPGLNFAFIGRQFDYHSPTASVATLDKGSLQHIGDQTLAAAASFAFAADLPGKAPDAVYSQTFGDNILAYPAWGGWILLLAIGGLIAVAVQRARKTFGLDWIGVARGAAGSLLVMLAADLTLHMARRATGVDFGFMAQRPLLAQWALWETTLAVLAVGVLLLIPALITKGVKRLWTAVAALVAGLLCQLFGGWDPMGAGLAAGAALLALGAFGRQTALPESWLGGLIVAFVVALALQAALPAVAIIVAWPLALAAVAAAASTLGQRLDLPRLALIALLAAIGGGWLAVYFHGVAQGLDLPAILGLFPWLASLLLWPLAMHDGKRAHGPALAILTVGFVLLVVVRFNDPWTPRHPQASMIFHVADQTTGKAWRVSTEAEPTDWTLSALGGKLQKRAFPPLTQRPAWAPPTPAVTTGAVELTTGLSPDGQFLVLVKPPAGARVISLDLRSDVAVTGAAIEGEPVKLLTKPGKWSHVRWQGAPDGLLLTFRPKGPGALTLRYAGLTERWPAAARPLPKRPAEVMPFDVSDSTVVVGEATVKW